LDHIPAGTYSVTAAREGYDTLSYEGILIRPGNRTIQNFRLENR
jgi:hypothetical protein